MHSINRYRILYKNHMLYQDKIMRRDIIAGSAEDAMTIARINLRVIMQTPYRTEEYPSLIFAIKPWISLRSIKNA